MKQLVYITHTLFKRFANYELMNTKAINTTVLYNMF